MPIGRQNGYKLTLYSFALLKMKELLQKYKMA